MRTLTYEEMTNLSPGQAVTYEAGEGEYYIKADAEIAGQPEKGNTAVLIRLTNIVRKESKVEFVKGDQIYAGPDELLLP